MKVKEFLTIRYGPLKIKTPFQLSDFNLFWGKNEEGKTLTIDALVKLLLGRNIRDFEHIDRVEENPEGYVIIEDDKGKEIKLPEKGDLAKVAGLTPSECRNIFIIRNSDLSIARESEFYTNVTDRLTGLRTEDISSIKNKLRELGKLTRPDSNASLSNSEEFGKIKSRIKDAAELIEEIDSLQDKIKKENFDELEVELARHKEEIGETKKQIENLQDARKREKYEKGKDALDKLKRALAKIKDLKIYNEDDEQLWRDCERETNIYGEEKGKLVTELRENEKEFKEISEKLSEKERDFQIYDERKKKIDDEIKPELKNYEMGVGKVKREETKSRFFTVAAIISAVLLSLSVLGVIMNPSPLLYGLLVSFLISTIIFSVLRFSFTKEKAHFAAIFERIRLSASRFKLDAESPKELYSNIQEFDEGCSRKAKELEEIRKEKGISEEKAKGLREKRIPEVEEKLRNAKDKIEDIKSKSKEESLQGYTEELRSKQTQERSIGEQKSFLKSLFEEKSEALEENISYWNEEIEDLKRYKDKTKDTKYSEILASELEEKKRGFEKKLQEINDRMVSLQKEMEEVQRKVNEILRLEEEYLYCKTSIDLGAVKDKLQGFIDRNESNKDNVLKATQIFEEIEIEEKEKVSELFGKESSISKYFTEITDGLYEEVMFNQETGEIEVRRRDGAMLEAEKLSGGAYDQLYLSIRLALGEKLLKGKKGFFIMDDPFVKADPDRVEKQIQIVRKISETGWQVIYFSAKKEINDILKRDIDRGAINYIKFQSIFS